MSLNPFIAPYDRLPATLPIFPLRGAIVMPGSNLPLNIFEPRYLNMVSDALATHHMIGMIQPGTAVANASGLCQTGCAGRITQFNETRDGCIEIVLSGVCRYDIIEELPTTRGYRLVTPDWSRFRDDYSDYEGRLHGEQDLLIDTLKRYCAAKGLETDWTVLEHLPMVSLLNSLSMALPLSEQDKQALLETVEPAERLYAFTALLDSELQTPGPATRH